jgi:hypothetical protein
VLRHEFKATVQWEITAHVTPTNPAF